ncbi:MAG: regulator of sigma D [Gammaproteobacteria bacterium]|jgi:regulator of sigma D
MTEDKIDTLDRRGGTAHVIGSMLTERKQLLRLLLEASEMKPENSEDLDRELLNEFCQVLVDYIAAGHFGLYERIVEGTERRRSVADLAVKLYPQIEETTQVTLAFNEKYDADRSDIDVSQLHRELSELGEQITNRIEYEDQIIQMLSEPK